MKPHIAVVRSLAADESGGELLEYALVTGVIVVAAVAVILAIGGKSVVRWTSINCSL